MPTPIQTARASVSRPMSRPMRVAEPEQPDGDDGDERREILRPDEPGEAPSANGGGRHAGDVVPDHDAGERAEQHALDQRRRGCDSGGARAEGARHAGDEPPGMSSAQLSMSMARTNAASTVAASTNHAADSPSAEDR